MSCVTGFLASFATCSTTYAALHSMLNQTTTIFERWFKSFVLVHPRQMLPSQTGFLKLNQKQLCCINWIRQRLCHGMRSCLCGCKFSSIISFLLTTKVQISNSNSRRSQRASNPNSRRSQRAAPLVCNTSLRRSVRLAKISAYT